MNAYAYIAVLNSNVYDDDDDVCGMCIQLVRGMLLSSTFVYTLICVFYVHENARVFFQVSS